VFLRPGRALVPAAITGALINAALIWLQEKRSAEAPTAKARVQTMGWMLSGFGRRSGRTRVAGGLVLLLIALAAPQAATAAPGDLDPSFDVDGRVTTSSGFDSSGGAALDPSGKVVVGGHALTETGGFDLGALRYNPDGSLDTSFSDDGVQTTAIADAVVSASGVALQTDGRVVVAGVSSSTTCDNFEACIVLVRYDSDGSLDTTFSGDGTQITALPTTNSTWGSNSTIDLALQDDGKIVAVTGFTNSWCSLGCGHNFTVARFNADGSLDTSFSGDGVQTTDLGGESDHASAVAIQSDGKILVAGQRISPTGDVRDFAVARLNNNGDLDSTFSGDGWATVDTGGLDDIPADLTVQADGRIIVAGGNSLDGDGDFALARLTVAGSLDSTFSGDGKLTTDFGSDSDFAYSVGVQPNGKIVVGGTGAKAGIPSDRSLAVARYTTAGNLDVGFSGDGRQTTDFGDERAAASAVLVQPDAKLLVAGSTCTDGQCDTALARYVGGEGVPDTIPPHTTITSGPTGAISTQTPVFGFSSSEDGSTFECRVGGGPFTTCTSPYTATALGEGSHVFEVRAIDASGNVDSTPAARSFTVDLPDAPSPQPPAGGGDPPTPTPPTPVAPVPTPSPSTPSAACRSATQKQARQVRAVRSLKRKLKQASSRRGKRSYRRKLGKAKRGLRKSKQVVRVRCP
jgi:uncharacterized delta-60 repeat protein